MDRLNQLLKMIDTSAEEERSLVDDLSAQERAQEGQVDAWSFKDYVPTTPSGDSGWPRT
ncbi:MAG: hypothetical protein ACK2UK_18990 [Candidatus Promineifilaceae bacterium]